MGAQSQVVSDHSPGRPPDPTVCNALSATGVLLRLKHLSLQQFLDTYAVVKLAVALTKLHLGEQERLGDLVKAICKGAPRLKRLQLYNSDEGEVWWIGGSKQKKKKKLGPN